MQSKTTSIAESVINTGSGLIINTIVQIIFFPYFGITVTVVKMGSLSIIFSALSLIRNYAVRRLFDKWRDGIQTKKMSMIESTVNTVAGIVLGFLIQFPLFYWFGFKVDIVDIAEITGIFAIAGFVKNYIVRRTVYVWWDSGLIQRKFLQLKKKFLKK